jgi:hypothetical protein
MFGREILRPEIGRKPIYDNVHNETGRSQSFACANCGARVVLDIVDCIGRNAHDAESVLGPDGGSHVREHFGILRNSLAQGWPLLSVASCPVCGRNHLIYVAVFEPRNGWQQAVLQGITELKPSNHSLQPDAYGGR